MYECMYAVIQYACIDLQSGIQGHKPQLYADNSLYAIMGLGIGMKLLLWLFCARVNQTLQSDSIGACLSLCLSFYMPAFLVGS